MWEYGLDRAGSGQGQAAGTCDCGNELSGSIKCGEVLHYLKTYELLKKDCATWSISQSTDVVFVNTNLWLKKGVLIRFTPLSCHVWVNLSFFHEVLADVHKQGIETQKREVLRPH